MNGESGISTEFLTVILSIFGTGITVALALGTLIITTSGRMSARLIAVEKETARLSALFEAMRETIDRLDKRFERLEKLSDSRAPSASADD